MAEGSINKILLENGCGEIVEKRSRFIANCISVHSEEEAAAHIEALRRKYWDAKHNCYAYVTGRNRSIQRFSDDKEPQGTAGKPILEVILSRSLCDTLIVVTRYFGGILLGTGGLVRAYSQAAAEGLNNSVISDIYYGSMLNVVCDYSASGKISYIAGQVSENGICCITDTIYSDNVRFELLLEDKLADTFISKITDATSGQASVTKKGAAAFAMKGGTPVIIDNKD